jgi:hypothetical protein
MTGTQIVPENCGFQTLMMETVPENCGFQTLMMETVPEIEQLQTLMMGTNVIPRTSEILTNRHAPNAKRISFI